MMTLTCDVVNAFNSVMLNDIKIACEDDKTKKSEVPFDTLGKDIVDRIPQDKLTSKILVMSDLGLLFAMFMRCRKISIKNITFIANAVKRKEFAEKLGIKTIYIPYGGELNSFLNDKQQTLIKEKFDVVVGNPPFQADVKRVSNKIVGGKGKSIWQKFIEHAFELSTCNAELLFVTPNKWRIGNFRKQSPLFCAQSKIFSNKIDWWLDVRNPKDFFPEVGNSNTIDAWHVIKGQKDDIPNILHEFCVLPNSTESLNKLANFFDICYSEESIKYIRTSCKIDCKSTNICPGHGYFPMVNTSAQAKKGIYDWTKTKPSSFDDKKVIVSGSGSFVVGYFDGQIANGHHTASYIVSSKEEGDRLLDFFDSPLMKFVARQFSQESSFGFPMQLFQRLPKSLLTKQWQEVFSACM